MKLCYLLRSSCENLSTSSSEALVGYLGIVETWPSAVRSGTAPWSLQQEPSLPCSLLSSHQQWICPVVKYIGDTRETFSLLLMQQRTWSDKVLLTGRPLFHFALPITHGNSGHWLDASLWVLGPKVG